MKQQSSNSARLARIIVALVLMANGAASVSAVESTHRVLVRDITTIEGVRDNLLVGYGLVVGLHGTGDRQQTFFTVQTLANAMQRMGVQISPGQVILITGQTSKMKVFEIY